MYWHPTIRLLFQSLILPLPSQRLHLKAWSRLQGLDYMDGTVLYFKGIYHLKSFLYLGNLWIGGLVGSLELTFDELVFIMLLIEKGQYILSTLFPTCIRDVFLYYLDINTIKLAFGTRLSMGSCYLFYFIILNIFKLDLVPNLINRFNLNC